MNVRNEFCASNCRQGQVDLPSNRPSFKMIQYLTSEWADKILRRVLASEGAVQIVNIENEYKNAILSAQVSLEAADVQFCPALFQNASS